MVATSNLLRVTCIFLLAVVLTACKSSPGPLTGTWEVADAVPTSPGEDRRPLRIVFSRGQVDAFGTVEPVSYKVDGNTVTMTFTESLLKGSSETYVVTQDIAVRSDVKFKRIYP